MYNKTLNIKNLCIVFIFMFSFSIDVFGALAGGTYTVGAGKDYNDIQSAFDDIITQSGLAGNVIYSIDPGTYSSANLSFNGNEGIDNGFTITLQPAAAGQVIVDATGQTNALQLIDVPWIFIDGSVGSEFVFKNSNEHGIYLENDLATTAVNHQFDYVIVQTIGLSGSFSCLYSATANSGQINVTNSTFDADAYGIYINQSAGITINTSTTINVTDSTVYGIYLNAADTISISSTSIDSTATAGPYGIYASNCTTSLSISSVTLTNTGFFDYGIYVTGCAGVTISNNTLNLDGTSNYGIYLTGMTTNPTIQDNTISSFVNTGLYLNATASIGGTIIDSNKIDGGGSGYFGIRLSTADGTGASKCNLYNNIIYGCTLSGISLASSDYWNIYYNTIYCPVQLSNSGVLLISNSTYSTLRNNILYNPTTSSDYAICLYIDAGSSTGLDSDYNDLIGSGNNRITYWAGSSTYDTTLSGWQATSSLDTNSISGYPFFNDPSTGNFTIWDFSPCESAGIDVGIGVDFNDTVRASYDIGAIEVTAGADTRLSGAKVIDDGGSGDYLSFTAAVTALETNGISGAITFTVKAGATGLYEPLVMTTRIKGISSVNTISFIEDIATTVVIDTDADASANTYAVEIADNSYISLNGIDFQDANEHIIYIHGDSHDITFNDFTISGVDLDTDNSTDGSAIYLTDDSVDNISFTSSSTVDGDEYVCYVNNADYITFQSFTMQNCQSSAIMVRNTNSSATTNITIDTITITGAGASGGSGAIVLENYYIDTVNINGCTIDGINNGIYADGSDNLTINGGSISSCQADGILIYNTAGPATSSINITGVDISGYGLSIADSGAITLNGQNVQNVTISNNTITANDYGIKIINGSDGTSISGGSISNAVKYGISIDNVANPTTTMTIDSVPITNPGSGFAGAGIYINGDSADNITITNCAIEGDEDGSVIYLADGDNITIGSAGNSNTLTIPDGSNNYGIYINTTSNSSISYNTIISNETSTNTIYGIYFTNTSSLSIGNNTFEGPASANGYYTTGIYGTSSSGLIVSNNTLKMTSTSDNGLSFSSFSSSLSVYGNTVSEYDSNGLYISASSTIQGTAVYNNTFNGTGIGISLISADGLNDSSRCNLYSNMISNAGEYSIYLSSTSYWNIVNNSIFDKCNFIDSAGEPQASISLVNSSTGVNIYNNSVYNANSKVVYNRQSTAYEPKNDLALVLSVDTSSVTNFNSDYNNFFNSGTNNKLIYFNGTYYSDLTAWQASGNDGNSISSNPWYNDIFTGDLHTWYYSPNIDSGSNTSIPTDIDGDARSGNYDIGADENTDAAPTVLTGSYDIGGGASDYIDIQSAVDDLLLKGIAPAGGDVTFNIYTGPYDKVFIQGQIKGSSQTASVIFKEQASENATIDASTGGDDNYALEIDGCSWLTFDGLTITNTLKSVVYIYGDSHDITIVNCTITNPDTDANDPSEAAVKLGDYVSSAFGIALDNITIQDCPNIDRDFYGIYMIGGDNLKINNVTISASDPTAASQVLIFGLGAYGADISLCNLSSSATVADISAINLQGSESSNIYQNTITGVFSDGIKLDSAENSDNSDIYSNNLNLTDSSNGITVGTSYIAIRQNTIAGTLSATGNGISFLGGGNSSGSEIYSNSISATTQYGIALFSAVGASGNEIKIYNNVIYNSTASCLYLTACDYCSLLHNTAYSSIAFGNRGVLSATTASSNITLYNNILFNSNITNNYSMTIYLESDSLTGFISDYNDLYNIGDNIIAMIDNGGSTTDYYSLTEWQGSAVSSDDNSISTNPWFNDLSSNDYSLWYYSPCKDTGYSSTGIGTDRDGTARDATPDIGAYEVSGTAPSPGPKMADLDIGGGANDFADITSALSYIETNGIYSATGITLNVYDGTYEGISLSIPIKGTSDTSPLELKAINPGSAVIDGSINTDVNALAISGVSNLTFTDLSFTNATGDCISVQNGSSYITFDGVIVSNADSDMDGENSGINISGYGTDNIIVKNSTINAPADNSGGVDASYGIFTSLGDNYDIDGNSLILQANTYAGVYLSASYYVTVRNNTIKDGAFGIYSDGSGSPDNSNMSYIYNNVIYNSTYDCIALDNASTFWGVYHNTLYALPTNASWGVLAIVNGSTDNETINNILFNGNATGYIVLVDTTSLTNTVLNYNDLFMTGSDGDNGLSFWWNNVNYLTLTDWQTNTSQDANSLAVDPIFTDLANGDLKPVEFIGAPTIDIGTNTISGTVGVDIDGITRDANPDLGAHEAPPDTTPPEDVTGLAIETGTNRLYLDWTNPDYLNSPPYTPSENVDFYGILILRSTSPIVDSPVDGTTYSVNDVLGSSKVVYWGTSMIEGSPIAWTDDGSDIGPPGSLTIYQTYYYSIHSFDDTYNFSTGSTISEMPTAQSDIEATPLTINLTVSQYEPSPADIPITLTNIGDRTIQWTASSSSGWFSIDLANGDLDGPYSTTSDSDTITVSFATSSLSQGTYAEPISIVGIDPENDNDSIVAPQQPITILVNLEVTPPPSLERTPSSITTTFTELDPNPSASSIDIYNSGGSTFDWTATTTASWMTLSPSSGTVTSETDTVSVVYDIMDLVPGIYKEDITITGTAYNITGSPKTVSVTLYIDPRPPQIGLTQSSFTFYAIQGGDNPTDQSFRIYNTSGGSLPLTWQLTENSEWLSVTPDTGTSSDSTDYDTVSIKVYSQNLAIVNSPYTAVITASGAGASNSPQSITVTLEMLQSFPPEISASPSSVYMDIIEGTKTATSSFYVQNIGGSIMNWVIDDNSPRIVVNPSSGQSVGDLDLVNVNIDTSGLTTTTSPYNASIFIHDPTASNNPLEIPVIINIIEAGKDYLVASAGANMPYDSNEKTNANLIEMSQVLLTANSSEDIRVNSITFTASGSADESTDILPSGVKLYLDSNSNGLVDDGETQLGSSKDFSTDDGTVVFDDISLVITSNSSSSIIATYTLSGTASTDETFQLNLNSSSDITATTETSNTSSLITGTYPLIGPVKTISSKGTLSVYLGESNPASATIEYDATSITMMQLKLVPSSVESLVVGSLSFGTYGTADEADDIWAVKLYKDNNGDGVVDSGDEQIGKDLTFTNNNGTIQFTELGQIIPASTPVYWLIVYDLNGKSENGEQFTAWLSSQSNIKGTGFLSSKDISIEGLPLTGNTMTIHKTDTIVIKLQKEEKTGQKTCFIRKINDNAYKTLWVLFLYFGVVLFGLIKLIFNRSSH